jgi:hypothetical protein
MSGAQHSTGASLAGAPRTDALVDNIAALKPKFAKIDLAASGDSTIVAAIAGYKIRVLSYVFGVGNTQQVKWKSGSTDLSGAMPFAQYGGITVPVSQFGQFETASGEALVLNAGNSNQVSGHLTYVEVPAS